MGPNNLSAGTTNSLAQQTQLPLSETNMNINVSIAETCTSINNCS
jgi:hypothetical protein